MPTVSPLRLASVRLQGVLADRYKHILIPGLRVALLDIPANGNVGDAAIYIGERVMLFRAGCRVVYEANLRNANFKTLRAAHPEAILLQGGGNLGDLYPWHQRFRERVLGEFPHTPIFGFPQTVTFRDVPDLWGLARHRGFTIGVRDTESFETLRAAGVAAFLVPDASFALSDRVASDYPNIRRHGIIRELYRKDGERLGSERETHFRMWLRAHRKDPWNNGGLINRGRAGDPERRLRYGLGYLSAARVCTDMLHGHILATMLGVPQTLFDTVGSKVRRFYETWTKGTEGIYPMWGTP